MVEHSQPRRRYVSKRFEGSFLLPFLTWCGLRWRPALAYVRKTSPRWLTVSYFDSQTSPPFPGMVIDLCCRVLATIRRVNLTMCKH